MKRISSDRHVLRPPLGLALCAGLGALSLTMPSYAGGADRPPEATASAQAKKVSCPTLAFTSTRDIEPDPSLTVLEDTFRRAEIYLMDLDPDADDPNLHGTNVRRLTKKNEDGDGFAILSPDGKGRIVFDSNRLRGTGPLNTSDLFLMNKNGGGQNFLVHGGAPSWSPDGKSIAFHASADGTQPPPSNNPNAGATTLDSDIFIAEIRHLLDGSRPPTNLTNDGATMIDGSPDWSPDGQTIVYRSHPYTDTPMNAANAEIYVRKVDGSFVKRLTNNSEEERAPLWSPDGSRIAYMCRLPGAEFNPPLPPNPPGPRFEICVMNADGSGQRRLTNNAVFDASPTWLPSVELEKGVLTHRLVIGRNVGVALGGQSLFMLSFTEAPGLASEVPLTIDWTGHPDPFEPQTYLLPSYGVIKGKCK